MLVNISKLVYAALTIGIKEGRTRVQGGMDCWKYLYADRKIKIKI